MAPSIQVVLVEDDTRLAELTATFLRRSGFEVTIFNTGEGVVEAVLASPPHALILDLELPGESGLSICRRVRDQYRGVILMLTARAEDMDEIIGFELGADDYIPKPANLRKLVLRLRAGLRRVAESPPSIDTKTGFFDPDLEIDASRRIVRVRGAVVRMTDAEFELLELLAKHVGRPVTRDQYYQEVRGIAYDGLDRTMDARLVKVRRLLVEAGLSADRIRTVRSVGYQLTPYGG